MCGSVRQVVLYHEVFSSVELGGILSRAAEADMSHMYQIYEDYLRYDSRLNYLYQSMRTTSGMTAG